MSLATLVRGAWQHGWWSAAELARRGLPGDLVYFYGQTPGDDLMCTAILHEMRARGSRRLWMMSRFPGLFERNPDVDAVVPFDPRYERMVSRLGRRACYAHYGGHDQAIDRSPIPERHIIALMCQACGITGRVALRPYLHLSESERHGGRQVGGTAVADAVVVHSSGMSAFSAMKNKEWVPGRLRRVVDELRRDVPLIQLGAATDPLLDGCIDLRGKTSMRESAAIIANARVLLGQVGFLMHLTRAVDTPAVIIYGGREQPWQSGYSCNTNLVTPLPCSPCWRWNACDNPIERLCMREIAIDDVLGAVRDRVAAPRTALAVDYDDIPHPHVAR